MEMFAPFMLVGVFVAIGFALLQGCMAHRKYGVLLAVLAEGAIGVALIWRVYGWVETIFSGPNDPGPGGLVAGIWAGATYLTVLAVLVLNMISGFVIWRLTRDG